MMSISSIKRTALMFLSGQQLLIAHDAPQKIRKLLWYYDWATIGDSIMDLSQRFLIDPRISIDLCMPHGPMELFIGDDRFRRVARSLDDCDAQYDMVIVQSFTTKTITRKIRYHPFTPWFSIMGHRKDERFSRIQLAYEQIARVFKSERESGPIEPVLTVSNGSVRRPDRFMIAVAVGGGDTRRRFENWATLIKLIASTWPEQTLSPRFLLLGTGKSALKAVEAVRDQVDHHHIDAHIELPSITAAAELIKQSSFFIGADGGLMHIAAALGKPGVAIFCQIKPEWRLHSQSKIQTVFAEQDINSIPIERIASEVTDYCRELLQEVRPEKAARED
ncbi:hypothetical protein LMG24238_05387 [Paraburkholderia sediminicola]|uniref:ADP-heptose:LPS heptosyltransferase n=1 Tax=Paraburkholderia sediminicola TaxID=458836 RepID=A0A6J5C6W8_9BURK|nr:glycosyltransferase family 9 protein [Paraburkholderia sediminicola]CAB3726853.1 hypothetical protein LMG24238_05387 [Paraburkholderia sediminicola]